MKKIIAVIILLPVLVLVMMLGDRFSKNKTTLVPYPYEFSQNYTRSQSESIPILILGDRLGKRLSLFKSLLAKKISQNLAKPIQIEIITEEFLSAARVKNILENFGALPVITVLLTGSSEYYEKKFDLKDVQLIEKNFGLFDNLKTQTLITLFPSLSRFIYHPIDYVSLPKEVQQDKEDYNIKEKIQRRILNYKLYERELKDIFLFLKRNNSYLIALTQPINLELAPRKNCDSKLDEFSKKNYQELLSLIKQRDFKSAYTVSKDLALVTPSNPNIHYLHGKVAKELGKMSEARLSLEKAAVYDCEDWRGSPIHNKILQKVANETQSVVFDFNELVYSSWGKNVLFESEIYPQNLYFEQLVNILGIKIKKVLRL